LFSHRGLRGHRDGKGKWKGKMEKNLAMKIQKNSLGVNIFLLFFGLKFSVASVTSVAKKFKK
jgi:ABC-type sulfate transport system permease component